MLQPAHRKPKRLYSALGVLGGLVLLWFELSPARRGDGEGWFWILVAALMIVLGLAGLFQRADSPEP